MLSLAELDKSNVFVASLNSLILAVTPTDVIQFILQPPLFTQSAKILRFFHWKKWHQNLAFTHEDDCYKLEFDGSADAQFLLKEIECRMRHSV